MLKKKEIWNNTVTLSFPVLKTVKRLSHLYNQNSKTNFFFVVVVIILINS